MVNVRDRRSRIYSGLGAVIALVICSLTLSLATRFCIQATSEVHVSKAVERRSIEPKRQHLNRDASRWVVSAANANFLEPVVLYVRAVPAESPLPNHVFDESLYNRPPPFGLSL
jgi:hypothetical protein